ncbi:MAG: hypothetical protein LBF88_02150 [Planctomycetaceae bacterium]|nr:hypothetical protein [Planctomycetaceae bacterium]
MFSRQYEKLLKKKRILTILAIICLKKKFIFWKFYNPAAQRQKATYDIAIAFRCSRILVIINLFVPQKQNSVVF